MAEELMGFEPVPARVGIDGEGDAVRQRESSLHGGDDGGDDVVFAFVEVDEEFVVDLHDEAGSFAFE